jgi:hypothetical protein
MTTNEKDVIFDPVVYVCPGCGGKWRTKRVQDHLVWRFCETDFGVANCSKTAGGNAAPDWFVEQFESRTKPV